MRAYGGWRMGASKSAAVAVVIVERLLGLVSLVLLASAAVLFSPDAVTRLVALPPWIGWLAAAILCGAVLGVAFVARRHPRSGSGAGGKIAKVHHALHFFQRQKTALMVGLALSL